LGRFFSTAASKTNKRHFHLHFGAQFEQLAALFTAKNRKSFSPRKITTPGVGVLQNVCGLLEFTNTGSVGIFFWQPWKVKFLKERSSRGVKTSMF